MISKLKVSIQTSKNQQRSCNYYYKINLILLHKMFMKALFLIALCTLPAVFCVRCYQCASSQNLEEDTCGAYKKFDTDSHIAVECNSDESHMPGSFCMKLTQQGPKGFIWDGRWRQVMRRCASVAETGVTGVCNWGVYDNGVYWEECYCSSDECNHSSYVHTSVSLIACAVGLIFTVYNRFL